MTKLKTPPQGNRLAKALTIAMLVSTSNMASAQEREKEAAPAQPAKATSGELDKITVTGSRISRAPRAGCGDFARIH